MYLNTGIDCCIFTQCYPYPVFLTEKALEWTAVFKGSSYNFQWPPTNLIHLQSPSHTRTDATFWAIMNVEVFVSIKLWISYWTLSHYIVCLFSCYTLCSAYRRLGRIEQDNTDSMTPWLHRFIVIIHWSLSTCVFKSFWAHIVWIIKNYDVIRTWHHQKHFMFPHLAAYHVPSMNAALARAQ